MCMMSLDLVKTREIYLLKEEYNASLSHIRFKLGPIDGKTWTQIRNIPLSIVSMLIKYKSAVIPTRLCL